MDAAANGRMRQDGNGRGPDLSGRHMPCGPHEEASHGPFDLVDQSGKSLGSSLECIVQVEQTVRVFS